MNICIHAECSKETKDKDTFESCNFEKWKVRAWENATLPVPGHDAQKQIFGSFGQDPSSHRGTVVSRYLE